MEKVENINENVENTCECHNHDNHCDCHKDACAGECACHDQDNILAAEIERLIAENANLAEKVKLAQAELVNYRRRKDEETQSMLKYANQDLIMELINVVDNFERAIKLDDNNLTEILKKFGVEEISRPGEKFDPALEQALLVYTVEELEDDVVIEVLLKGYKLKDRVIRPASVKINQK